jgi:hypothetical protein
MQFNMQNRTRAVSGACFSHAYFYEGRTLWCEKHCIEKKLYTRTAPRLIQLHDALRRAHRILVTATPTGVMSHAAAAGHLMEHVGFTRPAPSADVNCIPPQPPCDSYLHDFSKSKNSRAPPDRCPVQRRLLSHCACRSLVCTWSDGSLTRARRLPVIRRTTASAP